MADRVWVWHGLDEGAQHLASPPDDVTMEWDGETVCALAGSLRRVTWENVDGGKTCGECVREPFSLAGDYRGPP